MPGAAWSTDNTDCDDASLADNPGATEIVGNADDEDCDGSETCYDDDDNDGYLDTTGDTRGSTDLDCSDTYEGASGDATTDCDDASASDYPGATETVGNNDDEDCDGSETCYDDDDDDGYLDATGDTRTSIDLDCSDTYEGASSDPTTDCDDSASAVYPGATEVLDGQDNDCDGDGDDYVASDVAVYTVDGTATSAQAGIGGIYLEDDLDGDGDAELVICASQGEYTAADEGIVAFHDVDTLVTPPRSPAATTCCTVVRATMPSAPRSP